MCKKGKKTKQTWKTQISWTCRKGPGFELPPDDLAGGKRRQDQDPEYYVEDVDNKKIQKYNDTKIQKTNI